MSTCSTELKQNVDLLKVVAEKHEFLDVTPALSKLIVHVLNNFDSYRDLLPLRHVYKSNLTEVFLFEKSHHGRQAGSKVDMGHNLSWSRGAFIEMHGYWMRHLEKSRIGVPVYGRCFTYDSDRSLVFVHFIFEVKVSESDINHLRDSVSGVVVRVDSLLDGYNRIIDLITDLNYRLDGFESRLNALNRHMSHINVNTSEFVLLSNSNKRAIDSTTQDRNVRTRN